MEHGKFEFELETTAGYGQAVMASYHDEESD